MKWFSFKVIAEIIPHILLMPIVYMALKESSGAVDFRFWITIVMLFVLYVSFYTVHQAKTKKEMTNIQDRVLSGIWSYSLITVYVTWFLMKHDGFTENKALYFSYFILQTAQCLLFAKNYFLMKKKMK